MGDRGLPAARAGRRIAVVLVAMLVVAAGVVCPRDPASAAVPDTQQWVTGIRQDGDDLTLSFGASGVTATIANATGANCVLAAPTGGDAAYWSPSPPADALAQRLSCTQTGAAESFTQLVAFSRPIDGLMVHVTGLRSTELRFAGTSTTGAALDYDYIGGIYPDRSCKSNSPCVFDSDGAGGFVANPNPFDSASASSPDALARSGSARIHPVSGAVQQFAMEVRTAEFEPDPAGPSTFGYAFSFATGEEVLDPFAIISPVDGQVLDQARPVVAGTGLDGARIAVTFTDALGVPVASCEAIVAGGVWSCAPDVDLPDGLSAVTISSGGSAIASVRVTIEANPLTPPSPPIAPPEPGGSDPSDSGEDGAADDDAAARPPRPAAPAPRPVVPPRALVATGPAQPAAPPESARGLPEDAAAPPAPPVAPPAPPAPPVEPPPQPVAPPAQPEEHGGQATGSSIAQPSVLSMLPTPADTLAPTQVMLAAALTFVLVILVAIPTTLLNRASTIGIGRLAAWWSRRRRSDAPAGAASRWRRIADAGRGLPMAAAAMAAAAFTSGFVDPEFLRTPASARVLASILIGLFVNVGLGWVVLIRIQRALNPGGGHAFVVHASSLLVVAGTVLFTRLTGFQPGIVFGLVAGVTFAATRAGERARVALVTAGWALAMAIAAWLLYCAMPVPGPDQLGAVLVRESLAAITVTGIAALPLTLIPARGFFGHAVWEWRRWVWALSYGIGLLAFFLVLMPMPFAWKGIDTSLRSWVIVFVCYALFAVVVWALVMQPWRPDRALDAAAEENPQANLPIFESPLH